MIMFDIVIMCIFVYIGFRIVYAINGLKDTITDIYNDDSDIEETIGEKNDKKDDSENESDDTCVE